MSVRRELFEGLVATTVVLYDVIENYAVPVLIDYHQRSSSALFVFDGESVKTLGTQVTPITPESELPYDAVREIPEKNRRYGKYGLNLYQYMDVGPKPGNQILMGFGPQYCPGMDADCLIREAPRIAYTYCVGKPAPEDLAVAMAEAVSDQEKVRCLSDAFAGMKFIVRVRLDVIVEQLKDITIAVKAIVESLPLPPGVKVMLDADAMTARNHIANLMVKRVGTVFTVQPVLVIAMLRHAYTLVSGLVQALNFAVASTTTQ